MYAKFSEEVTFLIPSYVHVNIIQRGVTYKKIPFLMSIKIGMALK